MGWKEKNNKSTTNFNGKLSGNNLKLLGLLETWGALGLGQLRAACAEHRAPSERLMELFFNESFHYAGRTYMAVLRLQKRGLVQVFRALNAKQLYGLTGLGHGALRAADAARLPSFTQRISARTVDHRVACAGVGLALERVLGLAVLTERQVYRTIWRNLGKQRPKGFHLADLVAQGPAYRCFLEVELTQKADADYDAIWDFYRAKLKERDRALYLAASPLMARNLLDTARAKGADFLYFSDLPAFRARFARNTFRNFNGEEFRLA